MVRGRKGGEVKSSTCRKKPSRMNNLLPTIRYLQVPSIMRLSRVAVTLLPRQLELYNQGILLYSG